MRYTIRYDTENEKWAVIDTAFAEQELWRRHDPATERLAGMTT